MSEDERRFSAMYGECRQHVWAYAVSRGGRSVAEEVVSETFAIAWRRFASLPDPPLPWLLGIARNVLREGYRAELKRERFVAELRERATPPQADVAEDVAERQAALRALATLPEDERELLVLVAWHGLSPRAAAKVIGCSPATLRVRLHRARRRLQRELERPTEARPVRPRLGMIREEMP
ncbi:RNA polymerase sigma-70 factor (ECF subfamily) [Actinocorallia herbida]|uniref:RNA polymerase sigma-70 factor (ECF subfamily) n=1 Tax=Actinocorallia herbida TaxID=58109 RepID=A0A3N1DBB2_9ACTN|nr:sigma-70 family RNA polymerase sigma factor [Actinocorallia herbida]ROO90789.1 RNA polymerase sigma-70 factor (ECF subfamily) [Actinocorallia herbida]